MCFTRYDSILKIHTQKNVRGRKDSVKCRRQVALRAEGYDCSSSVNYDNKKRT